MAKKKGFNEKWTHRCDEMRVNIEQHTCSVTRLGLNNEELKLVMDFFLFNAPTIKNSETQTVNTFGQVSLKYYGWTGPSLMSKLESYLLSSSGIERFCIIKADNINLTLREMSLSGNHICITHPRAVMQQNCSCTINEDGSTTIEQKETRMECLFRHVRNAFAHNMVRRFPNGNILLEDQIKKNKPSSRILLPERALIEWANIVSKGPNL